MTLVIRVKCIYYNGEYYHLKCFQELQVDPSVIVFPMSATFKTIKEAKDEFLEIISDNLHTCQRCGNPCYKEIVELNKNGFKKKKIQVFIYYI